jgi:hypothetical protein
LPVQAPDLLEELLAGVGCVRRQQCEALPQEYTTPRPEDIADLVVVQRVLRQGGVNSILKLSALPDEHHPGARQITLVPQFARRNPYGRERAVPLQAIETSHVEPIGLVDLSHHQRRLPRVHELGDATRCLDLIDNPIPVADGLHGDRRAAFTPREKLLERPARVLDPLFSH